jgi:membrane fusion protein (multidrug efflux system)
MKTNGLKHTFLFLIILLAGAVACSGPAEEQANQSADEVKKVETGFSEIKEVEQEMTLTGNVEPYEQNIISPSMQLRIQKIYVEVGDPVRKGQLLVQMDPSQLVQTEVQMNHLEKEYARLDTLQKTGSVSQQQLDQMRTELDVTRSAYENLKENTRLVSPISGIVTARNFENGDMYSMATGAGILTVMQIDPVQVDVHIPEAFFPLVENGMPVSMQLDVYPEAEFKGEVFLKHPTINPATRTFTVETRFSNNDLKVRPGMFGRVKIVFETLERVTVPDLAVQRQQGTNDRFVFVVENGKAIRKVVETGRRVDAFYEITKGLSADVEVVVAGHAGLLDQAPVEVVK